MDHDLVLHHGVRFMIIRSVGYAEYAKYCAENQARSLKRERPGRTYYEISVD